LQSFWSGHVGTKKQKVGPGKDRISIFPTNRKIKFDVMLVIDLIKIFVIFIPPI
jgi:hypothetical protein